MRADAITGKIPRSSKEDNFQKYYPSTDKKMMGFTGHKTKEYSVKGQNALETKTMIVWSGVTYHVIHNYFGSLLSNEFLTI